MKINSTNNEAPSDDVTIDLDMFCALMEDRMKVDVDRLKKKKVMRTVLSSACMLPTWTPAP